MTEFTISDAELDGIKDQVVLVTGASSGIGLATVKRLHHHGAKVFASDINPLPSSLSTQENIAFQKADVSSWPDQVALFKAAHAKFGRIDHVFGNAGISPTSDLLADEFDEHGDLKAPGMRTYDVNLTGCVYTAKLAVHYIRRNVEEGKGGSIVLTASGSSFTRFPAVDYATAKHGVLGLTRSLSTTLHPQLPIRINAIGPSWTDTGIIPKDLLTALGDAVQSPDVVARSVIVLMTDRNRHGEFIYSDRGRFWDIENGERGLHARTAEMLGVDKERMEEGVRHLRELGVVEKATKKG